MTVDCLSKILFSLPVRMSQALRCSLACTVYELLGKRYFVQFSL